MSNYILTVLDDLDTLDSLARALNSKTVTPIDYQVALCESYRAISNAMVLRDWYKENPLQNGMT